MYQILKQHQSDDSEMPVTKKCSRKPKSVKKVSKNVIKVSEARLKRILGNLSKTAEEVLLTKDFNDKTKKKLEKVCSLAKEAMDQHPTSFSSAPPNKSVVRPPR